MKIRQTAIDAFLSRHPEGKMAMVAPEIKATNDESREILHVISTASVDRVGDVVVPAGAHLDNYLHNPVVLQDHEYSVDRIVGKATRIEVEKDQIWARTRFLDTERGRASFNLSKAGLGGWSIGFRPIKAVAIEDEKGRRKGLRFDEWELLEYSHVAIPMNQDAVNEAVERGIVSKEFAREFFIVEDPDDEPTDTVAEPVPTATVVRVSPHPALVRSVARANRRLAYHRLADALGEIADELEK